MIIALCTTTVLTASSAHYAAAPEGGRFGSEREASKAAGHEAHHFLLHDCTSRRRYINPWVAYQCVNLWVARTLGCLPSLRSRSSDDTFAPVRLAASVAETHQSQGRTMKEENLMNALVSLCTCLQMMTATSASGAVTARGRRWFRQPSGSCHPPPHRRAACASSRGPCRSYRPPSTRKICCSSRRWIDLIANRRRSASGGGSSRGVGLGPCPLSRHRQRQKIRLHDCLIRRCSCKHRSHCISGGLSAPETADSLQLRQYLGNLPQAVLLAEQAQQRRRLHQS